MYYDDKIEVYMYIQKGFWQKWDVYEKQFLQVF